MTWSQALITGASSGIGEAFARRLAADGVNLVVVARREDRLRRLAGDLEAEHGVQVEVIVADLTAEEDLVLVEKRLESDERSIDLLINNAGGHRILGPFVSQDRAVVQSDALLNAMAVLRLTHAALASMVPKARGHIIQVSSATAFAPTPGQAAYVASKAFVNSFSEAIRRELRRSGVRITVICPGFTRTETPPMLGFTDDNVPRIMWQDPRQVVDSALRAAERGRRAVYTMGWLNKVLGRLSYYSPRPIVIRVVETIMRPRRADAG
jgi:short-subunit dehydrogenase